MGTEAIHLAVQPLVIPEMPSSWRSFFQTETIECRFEASRTPVCICVFTTSIGCVTVTDALMEMKEESVG